MTPVDHFINLLFISLEDGLDPALGQVPHPPFEPKLYGPISSIGPVEDSLDSARYE